MAPLCKCGHKASEHHKALNMRTYCEHVDHPHAGELLCVCLMYRPVASVHVRARTPEEENN